MIEDGPTLTHGEMKYRRRRRRGAAATAPPRSSTRDRGRSARSRRRYDKYDVGAVLPAMGYSDGQLAEMAQIIDAADADLVVIGTPIDLRRVIDISKPAVRVRYDLEVLPDSPTLLDVLKPVLRTVTEPPHGTRRRRARRERAAAPRRGRHVRGDVRGRPRRGGAGSPTSPPHGWEVVVTHGNGPQVGRILLQQEAAAELGARRCRWTSAAPRARGRSATCSRSRSATCSSSAGWSGRSRRS